MDTCKYTSCAVSFVLAQSDSRIRCKLPNIILISGSGIVEEIFNVFQTKIVSCRANRIGSRASTIIQLVDTTTIIIEVCVQAISVGATIWYIVIRVSRRDLLALDPCSVALRKEGERYREIVVSGVLCYTDLAPALAFQLDHGILPGL